MQAYSTGAASDSLAVRVPGQRKRPCDIASVADVLLVSKDLDPDGAHYAVGLRKAWPRPYPGSSSRRYQDPQRRTY